MASEREFTAIRVATLRGDMEIPFDVYVKIADKYILYCRSGTSFEGTRLDRLRSKKLRKMYVKKIDEPPYKKYLDLNIDNAYKGGRPINVRAEVIQGFQQAVTEDFFENPLDEFTYNHLRRSSQRFTEFLQGEPEATKALLEIRNIDQSVSHHGVAVATLAVALALEAKKTEGIQIQMLALGCLLHDIDHYFDGLDLSRPLKELSESELVLYKEHTLKGAHRLQGATFLDQLVLNVITQHEEHMDGSGYPKGLRERDMDPLVLLAGLANTYDRLIGFEGLEPKEAVKRLMIQSLGLYPLEDIQLLQNLLKKMQMIAA